MANTIKEPRATCQWNPLFLDQPCQCADCTINPVKCLGCERDACEQDLCTITGCPHYTPRYIRKKKREEGAQS